MSILEGVENMNCILWVLKKAVAQHRVILSIMCLAFLLVSQGSTGYASQFVHKDPEYIENWFLEVHQKELLGIKYKPVYSGRTHGEEVEKLADGSIIHKASDGNFTIEQTENHYVLKFKDAKLQYGSYSHAFEFDMEKLEKNEEESIYFDDENGIEVILRKSLEKVWSPWLW